VTPSPPLRRTGSPLPQAGQDVETAHVLPLAFFGAGQLWFLIGALGLVVIAPDLAAGQLSSPRVFAVTHAFTLGMVASVIFGASHQFVPAVMGVPIRRWWVAILGFLTFEAGVVTLVASLWRWNLAGQAVGWTVLLCGVGFASWNTLPARRKAKRNRDVGNSLSLGHSALGLVLLLAGARIGAGFGWWSVGRDTLLAAHFHLGVLGFGSLTIAGVGSRMLPAFLQAASAPEGSLTRFQRWASSGLILYVTGVLLQWRPLTTLGSIVMALAVGIHLRMMLGHFRTRRSALDASLGTILLAVSSYGVTLVLGLVLLGTQVTGGRIWAAYAFFAIVGWLCLMALGVMTRVVPRVATLLAAAHGARPKAATAVWSPSRWQWSSVVALAVGILGVGGGMVLGDASLVWGSALVFAAGAFLAAPPVLRGVSTGVATNFEGGGTPGR